MTLPDISLFAIPFYILTMIAEIIIWKRGGRARYETRDTAASLLMGTGSIVAGALTVGMFVPVFVFVHEHRLFDLGFSIWVFAAAFVMKDFSYYWFHRWSHEVRWFWAAHVIHHSSQHYNLSTALRQTWTGSFTGLFVVALPWIYLGVDPVIYAFVGGLNLVYQYWIHTETIDRVGKQGGWFEMIMNTPSHHRVHHATNPRYIDANYAGVFIIWDRLFGSFVNETAEEKPRYGIVKNLHTFNPLRIATHEYVGIVKDWLSARSLKDLWSYTFGPPGWSPDGSRKTSRSLKEEWQKSQLSAPAD